MIWQSVIRTNIVLCGVLILVLKVFLHTDEGIDKIMPIHCGPGYVSLWSQENLFLHLQIYLFSFSHSSDYRFCWVSLWQPGGKIWNFNNFLTNLVLSRNIKLIRWCAVVVIKHREFSIVKSGGMKLYKFLKRNQSLFETIIYAKKTLKGWSHCCWFTWAHPFWDRTKVKLGLLFFSFFFLDQLSGNKKNILDLIFFLIPDGTINFDRVTLTVTFELHCENFNFAHYFLTISMIYRHRAFIFDMCVPYDKTFYGTINFDHVTLTVTFDDIRKTLTLHDSFLTVRHRAFILSKCVLYDKTFPLGLLILITWPWPRPLTYI